MTKDAIPATQLSLQDRRAILEKVLATLRERFYAPEKLDANWEAAVERHRPLIEGATTADALEQAMSALLAGLHTSHLGFFHGSARRASSRAALSATYLADETPYGSRWIFQDVHAGGAASMAGIAPGDILLSVDGRDIAPPEHPVFPYQCCSYPGSLLPSTSGSLFFGADVHSSPAKSSPSLAQSPAIRGAY